MKVVERIFTNFLIKCTSLNIFLINVRTHGTGIFASRTDGDINTIKKYIDLFEYKYSPDRKNYDDVYHLLIDNAFNWGNTPQDYYFWQKVSASWENLWLDYCKRSKELPKTNFKSIW